LRRAKKALFSRGAPAGKVAFPTCAQCVFRGAFNVRRSVVRLTISGRAFLAPRLLPARWTSGGNGGTQAATDDPKAPSSSAPTVVR
jgi:hypothetical protein